VFGVFLGFLFLDPASGGSDEPIPPRHGDTPTPIRPTPQPPSQLPVPTSWEVTFASISNGKETPDSLRIIPDLNLDFGQAPFPDYRDDSWRVTAETSVPLGKGSSVFVIRYDAAIRVFVNDSEVASRPEPEDGAQELVVTFEHGTGRAHIRIEATDQSGAFALQFEGQ
jgi:hypothetical protein